MQSNHPLPASLARRRWLACGAATSLLALFGCGGGAGGGSGGGVAGVGTGGTGSFSSGPIRGFGSVIVNNVRYDDTTASIVDDAGSAGRATDLRLGMVVEVSGSDITTDAAGLRRATASAISLRSEIEGPISTIDTATGTLTVLGQQVRLTAATVFDDELRGGINSLAPGQTVEVYGLMNSAGHYTATRIERENGVQSHYKLRGPVSGLDTAARTLRIGTAVVFYGDVAAQVPALANGQYARLELATTPTTGGLWRATRIQTASTGNAVPTTGTVNVELEGFITAFTSSARFSVNGVAVDASGVIRLPAGVALGRRVEVKGLLTNGQLTAREVELEDDDGDSDGGFEIEGAITSVDATARSFTVRGVVVSYANARFEDGTAANLAVGVKVEVKGQLSPDGTTLVAQEVEFDD